MLGEPDDWAARLGFATVHILDGKRSTMGYNGLLYLGEKIAARIENPGFNVKLARYADLGYKQSWYSSDPFKFIVDEDNAPRPQQRAKDLDSRAYAGVATIRGGA
jgi:hypothetical protein